MLQSCNIDQAHDHMNKIKQFFWITLPFLFLLHRANNSEAKKCMFGITIGDWNLKDALICFSYFLKSPLAIQTDKNSLWNYKWGLQTHNVHGIH